MTNSAVNRFQQFVIFIRANEWWSFKLVPIFGTVYATAAIVDISLIALWSSLLFLLIAVVVGASYASIINKLCDQKEDRIAGKTNYMSGRSPIFIALVLAACIVPGLVVSGLLIQAPLALVIYVSNWLVFTVYSLPPIRLKQRGFLGIIAVAVAENLLPQVFAVLLVIHDTGKGLPVMWIVLIAIWALASGCRSILWHQIVDFESDYRAGVNTFAVRTSPVTLQKLGEWIVFPVEVVALIGILLLSNNALAWAFLGLYLITEWLRHYFWQISIVVIAPYDNHRLILFEYYDLFYPLAFLCSFVWTKPINLIILGIHFLLCFQRMLWWMRDIWGLLRWEIPNNIKKHI